MSRFQNVNNLKMIVEILEENSFSISYKDISSGDIAKMSPRNFYRYFRIIDPRNETQEDDERFLVIDFAEKKKQENTLKKDAFVFEISDDGILTIKKDGHIIDELSVRGIEGKRGPEGIGLQGPKGSDGEDGQTWKPVFTNDGKHLYFQNSEGKKTEEYPVIGPTGAEGKSSYNLWQELQPNPDDCTIDSFWKFLKGRNGSDGDSAFEVWTKLHKEEGKIKTEEDFFNDIVGRVKTQEGATFIPEFMLDGKLYFKNSKTGESTVPFPIKGIDGKTFYPRFDEENRIYFVDENGISQTKVYDIRGKKGENGKDGQTFKPKWIDSSLYFETDDGEKSETRDLHGKDAFELWKEKHYKPDATFKEYEEFFKGANIKSQYSYEDIMDSEIPVQKINRNMITDSDLTDGLGAEEYYRYRQERIEAIREKGQVMRGNWFQEIFWWSAGADTSVLRTCQSDHSKYVGIGTMIFFTALMAFFSCFIAMQLVFGEYKDEYTFPIGAIITIPLLITSIIVFFHYGINRSITEKKIKEKGSYKEKVEYQTKTNLNGCNIIIAIILFVIACCLPFQEHIPLIQKLPTISKTSGIAAIIAMFWSAMIFFFDRFITSTMYSDGKTTISWLELRSALPRIVISVFLGIIISAPLEIKIFGSEINDYIRNNIISRATIEIQNSTEYKNINKLLETYENSYNNAVMSYNKFLDKKNADSSYYSKANTETKRHFNDAGIKVDETGSIPSLQFKQAQWNTDKATAEVKKDSALQYFKKAQENIKLVEDSLKKHYCGSLYIDSLVKNAGLFDKLNALHYIAINGNISEVIINNTYPNQDFTSLVKIENKTNYIEWELKNSDKLIIGLSIFTLLMLITIKGWTGCVLELEKNNETRKYRLWNLTYIIPINLIVALICSMNCDSLFHALPTYCCSSIGLIMLLFILIDISPVFYKMMLADGRYDKILHQDKLLEQDLIRLQVAKTLYKVNESKLSSLSPFIFGKTFRKISDILKAKKEKDEKKKKAFDLYEPTDGLSQDIKQANDKLFKDVLNMKYRIAWGAYSAWYRNMYDVMLGKKDDDEGAKINPHNTDKQNVELNNGSTEIS